MTYAFTLPQSLNPFALEARGLSLLHCTSFYTAECMSYAETKPACSSPIPRVPHNGLYIGLILFPL